MSKHDDTTTILATLAGLVSKLDSRLEALETAAAAPKGKGKGRKGKTAKRKVDTRTANEKACAKLMRRIAWHEDRMASLGDKARPGQVKWNNAEIARLTAELERLRAHAATEGETLPADVVADRARRSMARKGRTLDATVEGIMGAHKGDTVTIGDVLFTCSGGGWFRDAEGDSIRRGDLADLLA